MLALTACDQRPDTGPVVVSAIGDPPALIDAARNSQDTPSRLLADSIAEGLVRFDAAGQIEPGLAERWIVIDGGTSYIFRLREAQWADGSEVSADQVVETLDRQLSHGSRNPLTPFLTAIDEIVTMTPQVIEIRLKRPRPDLLKLFAQPMLALWPSRARGGASPMRIAAAGRSPLLRPAIDLSRADPDDQRHVSPEENVRLIGERAARAIVRFGARESDLVSGGTFVDRPLLGLVDVKPAEIRLDPAAGLFGLAIVNRSGFLADAANRAAIDAAIDRTAMTTAIASDWEATDHILPDQLDSAATPALPTWTAQALDDRRASARARVSAWAHPIGVRVAMPIGPGATTAYATIAASLLAIGITPRRVGLRDEADMRLIDAVAPYDSARWYLANACALCGDAARSVVLAARDAPTLTERSRLIAAADIALRDDVAFIPLARPMRWSLVASRLTQWRPNPRAWHPLNRLRDDPR